MNKPCVKIRVGISEKGSPGPARMGLGVDKGPSIVQALPWGLRHILQEKLGPWALMAWDKVEALLSMWPCQAIWDCGQEGSCKSRPLGSSLDSESHCSFSGQ